MHKFDLSDEEVMAYYISFLKTMSFKLNPHTIHFFFNTSDFPLYTEAVRYFNHPEKMVRIAVRILTLNVFKVDEKSMLKFITGQTAPCLADLVHFIRDNVINIEKCLKDSLQSPSAAISPLNMPQSPIKDKSPKVNNNSSNNRTNQSPTKTNSQNNLSNIDLSNLSAISSSNTDKLLLKLEDLFAEHLDHLHYLNDILMLKIDDINRILSDNLMHHLIKPLVDAYKDDPHNSMIRLFTLEFATGILSKVLATSLYDETPDGDDINHVADDASDRLANDVKDYDEKQSLTNDKLSSAQLAIVEQSKEIAELKIKTLLKTDTRPEMTYLSVFEAEYNEMRKKRLTIDYLIMDIPTSPSSSSLQLIDRNNSGNNYFKGSTQSESKSDIGRARYQIRDFLLWRQLLLNIRNEKDRELSLKNTSWLSYAKLLQWLE